MRLPHWIKRPCAKHAGRFNLECPGCNSKNAEYVMPLPTRTWPYGTEKPAKVLLVHDRVRLREGMTTRVVTVGDESPDREAEEAFILIHEMADCKVGELVTIVFCEGGPTGGYWRIKP